MSRLEWKYPNNQTYNNCETMRTISLYWGEVVFYSLYTVIVKAEHNSATNL